MDFAPSFYNESSALSINIMIVDDDPTVLKTMSRQIEKSKCRDSSVVMEIGVIAEKNPIEALSTLQVQRNNIDLIITDYYMPDMNGLQLKNQITQEYGNLPVLVMSVDKEREQESLTCGALGFFPKPIKSTDLPRIYEFALTYKRNGNLILSSTELNHKDTHVSIPKQIQLLPDPQANVVKTKKMYSDSIKNQKRNPNVVGPSDDGESQSLPAKKAKVMWTPDLHQKFLEAIEHIGHGKAVPKKILEIMNEPNLTRQNVASHLQKYRIRLRKQVVDPWSNHFAPSTWYDRSLNDGNFYTNSEYGLSQSRLTPEPFRFNQMPNYMNRSYIGSGSNFTLPVQKNLFPPNQPSQNVERRYLFKPSLMNTTMDQTSQGFGFGLLGPTYNNFNNDMMSGYGSFASNQPGSSNFSYGSIESFLNNESPQPHPSATTQPDYELPQVNNLNFFSDLDQANELLYNITNNSGFDQQQQGEDASTIFDLPADFFNNDMMSGYGSFASNQPGSSHFSYGSIESFLNSENIACDPQPNYELPPLDDLNQTYDFPYNIISNSAFDQQQQGEDASTEFDLPADFFAELDQIRPLEDLVDLISPNTDQEQEGKDASTIFDLPADFFTEPDQIPPLEDLVDLIFPNTDQGQFNEETSNVFAAIETNPPISGMNPSQNFFNGEASNSVYATETNPPTFNVIPDQNQFDEETSNILANPTIFNMNPNQNQEQDDDDVSGFIPWASWEPQELLDDGLNSLFNDMNDMN